MLNRLFGAARPLRNVAVPTAGGFTVHLPASVPTLDHFIENNRGMQADAQQSVQFIVVIGVHAGVLPFRASSPQSVKPLHGVLVAQSKGVWFPCPQKKAPTLGLSVGACFT